MATDISWSSLLLHVGKGEQMSCLCHIWLWDMRPFHGPCFDDELGLKAAPDHGDESKISGLTQ